MIVHRRFHADLLINYLSLAVLGVAGVLINTMLAVCYGTTILGRFNFSYAIYILLAQVATLGVQFSTSRSLSLLEHQLLPLRRQIVTSSIVAVSLTAILTSCLVLFIRPIFAEHESLKAINQPLLCIALALPFFAINKVIISALNGLGFMRYFALSQGCRYCLLLIYVFLMCIYHASDFYLVYGFATTELLLFIFLLPVLYFKVVEKEFLFSTAWLKNHLRFGSNAFLGGISQELNSRVDILILGLLSSTEIVGLYSFASTVVEGMSLMLVVIKNNINPIYTRLLHEGRTNDLQHFMHKFRFYTYAGTAILFVVVLAFYALAVNTPWLPAELSQTWLVLLISGGCLVLVSGYLPFSDFLVQANYPRWQSCQSLLVMIVNVNLCLLLIPIAGQYGAALAFGLSTFVVSILLIGFFSKIHKLSFFKRNNLIQIS